MMRELRRRTTPLDAMMDAVVSCTKCGAPGIGTCACWDAVPLLPPDVIDALATALAAQVLEHIDTMYPAMWQGVPTTARVSVRQTIYNAATSMLKGITGEAER